MKFTFTLLLTFFIWTNSFSQNHILTLAGQKMELASNSFQVTKIIDERAEKGNIGYVQKGLSNIQVYANFSNPLDKEVKEFLAGNLQAKGPEIQLIIKDLKIYERTETIMENGYCDLSIDFLMEQEGKVYRVLQSSQTSKFRAMDVTPNNPKNIANAFKLCFDELAKVDLSNRNNFLALGNSIDNLNAIPDSVNFNFPIFKQKIKSGIYFTYDELKNNSPGLTTDIKIEKEARLTEPWIGSYNLIPRFKNKSDKKIWGFSHEGIVYIYHQKEYFPVTINNYKILFEGFGIPTNQTVVAGALVGGLIGAGLGTEVESAKARKQKVKYQVNPVSGSYDVVSLEGFNNKSSK